MRNATGGNQTARVIALGSLYGMTLTLLYFDWRLGAISFVAAALGATAQKNATA